jgi:hypothetical protein
MGKHLMGKTGNIAAVQQQLSHKNVAYSLLSIQGLVMRNWNGH